MQCYLSSILLDCGTRVDVKARLKCVGFADVTRTSNKHVFGKIEKAQ